MTTRTLARTGVSLATVSMAVTLGIWGWVLTRPEGTFHDQGGLRITLFYFPATFAAWLLCALPGAALGWRKVRSGPEAEATKSGYRLVFGLIALALLLSIGTLFIA